MPRKGELTKQQRCLKKLESLGSSSSAVSKKRVREEEPSLYCLEKDQKIKKVLTNQSSAKQLPLRPDIMDSEIESRRQEFYRKADWRPIDQQMFPTPMKDSPPPDENSDPILLQSKNRLHLKQRPGVLQEIGNSADSSPPSRYQFRNIFTSDCSPSRLSPLPCLSWADSEELWKSMVSKESIYYRTSNYMCRHADLQPRMRSVLLDWIMEVCEVYTLHRETFYLAVDYIDRYLSNTKNIHKTRLQLVGVTALFIAAKLEEIYPPKLSDFAYVTDGACSEDEILSQELLMLGTLKWSLSPVTAVAWLNVYLQTAHAAFSPSPSPSSAFFLPQYPQETFVHITQLLDLCLLDIESLKFSSGVLAASALYHFSSVELATQVSGYKFKDISSCVHWMAPFAMTVRDTGLQPLKQFNKAATQADAHNIQTHSTTIDILDTVAENRTRVHTQLTSHSPTETCFMTPPKSDEKQQPMVAETSPLCGT